MKLTAESTVINDSKLNTNIDNAQAAADRAQSTADEAINKANGSVVTDTLHYLATSQDSGVTTSTPGWTTTPQTITPENKYLWTYHTYTKADETTTDTTPVITGTYGEDGTSVTILGSYDTLEELEQAHPTGNLGDAYLVAGDLYVWNGSAWENVGQIQGPQGPQGDTGVGISEVQPQYYLSDSPSTTTGGSWSQTLVYSAGKYIWTRERITYTNSTTGYSTAIYNSALTGACEDSARALSIASDTAQYFWFTSSGNDTGAHISEKTQAEFITNPSGGNLLARSNGIAVRDGMTELATFGASGARVGKSNDSHVQLAPTSIEMQTKPTASGNPITTFEVAQTSTSVKMTRVYNVSFTDMSDFYNDTINLGRVASQWASIKLRYKINSGSITTATYSSVPIDVSSGKFKFSFSIVSGSTTEYAIQLGQGESLGDSETLYIIDLELNFTTTQQVVESTIGAYANKTQSGVLRIGNGTGSSATSNAMLLDWAGNANFKGDVVAFCESDSSGGTSLTKVKELSEVYYYEDDGLYFGVDVYQIGRIVTLYFYGEKYYSVASGGNIFNANLRNSHVPVPACGEVTGATYYDSHTIGILLTVAGDDGDWHLICRNASNSAVTVSSGIVGTLTYLAENYYTDEEII